MSSGSCERCRDVAGRRMPSHEVGWRAGCGKSARPVRRAGRGNRSSGHIRLSPRLSSTLLLGSVWILAGGAIKPNALGVAFVLLQAGAVAVLAALEYMGLQRLVQTR